jgi:hypothetical protein
MDCSTARLFLLFQKNGSPELAGLEAAELERHLAHCSECNARALEQHRLDQHLGRAMCDVTPPKGLQNQILERLAQDRRERWQRYFGLGLRGVAAVAAVLLVCLAVWLFSRGEKPELLADNIVHDFVVCRPDEVGSNSRLRLLGTRSSAPDFVNYQYLVGEPSLAILPATREMRDPPRVPQFVFVHGSQRAVIYVVPSNRFRVLEQSPDQGYPYRVDVEPHESGKFLYVILYTGNNWDWLRAAPSE